jgi:hypothetical protein
VREWFTECVGCELNDLISLLPKSAVMVSHRPPFDCSSSVSRSWSALLWRSCRRPAIEGHLPAMWELLMNWPHIGHLGVLFAREEAGVVSAPHKFHYV